MEYGATIPCMDGVLAKVTYIKRYAPFLLPIHYLSASLTLPCAVLQAYLEFFASPALLSTLLPYISRDPDITYYAINKHGDLRTNSHSEGPNAVTWGVFPGKEIIQPTIVEAISFMAWKVRSPHHLRSPKNTFLSVNDVQDEAFELGMQWAKLYEPGSASRNVITEMMENYFLVNVVHNDFQDTEAIFRPFWAVAADAGLDTPEIQRLTNGVRQLEVASVA